MEKQGLPDVTGSIEYIKQHHISVECDLQRLMDIVLFGQLATWLYSEPRHTCYHLTSNVANSFHYEYLIKHRVLNGNLQPELE